MNDLRVVHFRGDDKAGCQNEERLKHDRTSHEYRHGPYPRPVLPGMASNAPAGIIANRGSASLVGCRLGGMRERRRRFAANNRRYFVDERVIFEGCHHEEGKVHAARDVARQDGVANVPTPDWQTLALTFFEVAPSYNRPPRVACKHAPAGLHLVIEVHDAG